MTDWLGLETWRFLASHFECWWYDLRLSFKKIFLSRASAHCVLVVWHKNYLACSGPTWVTRTTRTLVRHQWQASALHCSSTMHQSSTNFYHSSMLGRIVQLPKIYFCFLILDKWLFLKTLKLNNKGADYKFFTTINNSKMICINEQKLSTVETRIYFSFFICHQPTSHQQLDWECVTTRLC